MDREEAITLLTGGEEGVREWNKRYEHRDQEKEGFPDLSGADLSDAKLLGANLIEADLANASFVGADLTHAVLAVANLKNANLWSARLDGAILMGADLCGARLVDAGLNDANLHDAELDGACLTRADLQNANLSDASLRAANLTEAHLLETNLAGTNLDDADVRRAQFGSTLLGGVDLSSVRGLDSVHHHVPSTVGVDTLLASHGKIPDAFLRGCGVDPLIQKIVLGDRKALTDAAYAAHDRPMKLQSCFMSYCTADKPFADRLAGALNDAKIDYWYADEHLVDGSPIHESIDREIQTRDRTIVLLSEAALRSGWVRAEMKKALKRERERREAGKENWRVLWPVMIDDSFDNTEQPDLVKLRDDVKASDFRGATEGGAFEERLAKLIEGLRQ